MQTKNTFVLPITFEIQICVNPSQQYPINVGILLNYQTLERVSWLAGGVTVDVSEGRRGEGRGINLNQELILAGSPSRPGVNIAVHQLQLAPRNTCISSL